MGKIIPCEIHKAEYNKETFMDIVPYEIDLEGTMSKGGKQDIFQFNTKDIEYDEIKFKVKRK